MNRRKLLQRILHGSHSNIQFSDFVNLLTGLGFHEERIHGSHHMFRHPSVPDQVNLQSDRGQAKAYQVRQLVKLIRRYNLELENEP